MATAKVKLDKELIKRAEKYADAAGYSSVEEFISHSLENAIVQLEESESAEELQEKLKGLGYIA